MAPCTGKWKTIHYSLYTSYLKSIISKRKRNIQDKSRKKSFTSFIMYNKFENFFVYFMDSGVRDVILLFMTMNDVKMLCKILENR